MTIFSATLRKELNASKQTVEALSNSITTLKAEHNTRVQEFEKEIADLKSKTTDVAEISATYHLEKEKWEKAMENLKAENTKVIEAQAKTFQTKLDTLTKEKANSDVEMQKLQEALNTKQDIDKKSIDEMVMKQLAAKLTAMGLKEGTIPAAIEPDNTKTHVLEQANRLQGKELAEYLVKNKTAIYEALKNSK